MRRNDGPDVNSISTAGVGNIGAHGMVRTVLALVAVAAIVALCAAAPGWLFAQMDEELFRGSLLLQRQSGRLAAEAEDIYLVRALHRRTQLQRESASLAAETGPISAEEVSGDFSALHSGGVLSKELLRSIEEMLDEAGTAALTQTADGTGFVRVHCAFALGNIYYEKEEVTGIITGLWSNGLSVPNDSDDTEAVCAETLDAYLAYTGLAQLNDWGQVNGVYKAARQSQNAQMMAFCNDGLAFGIAAI